MASGDFTYSTPTYFNPEEWNNEASEFLWDSPQPEPQDLLSFQDDHGDQIMDQTDPIDASQIKLEPQEQPMSGPSTHKRGAKHGQAPSGSGAPHAMFSMQSSASESSSHSSSSRSSRRKRKVSSDSSPPAFFGVAATANVEEQLPGNMKMERAFGDMDEIYQFEDSTFPTMGAGMDSLSLDAMGGLMSNPQFDITSAAASPDAMGMFTDIKSEGYSPQVLNSLRAQQSLTASPVRNPAH